MTADDDPKPPPSNPSAGRPTDSAWFWLAFFLVGAIVALFLTAPKYSWRQPQIEREYQARERSGLAISPPEGPTPLSQTGSPMLTLRPLLVIFTLALIVSTLVFWIRRLRHLSRRDMNK